MTATLNELFDQNFELSQQLEQIKQRNEQVIINLKTIENIFVNA